MALGRIEERIKPNLEKKAKERLAAAGPAEGRGRKQTGSADSAEPVGSTGEVRDVVAELLGAGRDKVSKIKEIGDAAKKNPDEYGDLVQRTERPAPQGNIYYEIVDIDLRIGADRRDGGTLRSLFQMPRGARDGHKSDPLHPSCHASRRPSLGFADSEH